jgi:hypothetical protein
MPVVGVSGLVCVIPTEGASKMKSPSPLCSIRAYVDRDSQSHDCQLAILIVVRSNCSSGVSRSRLCSQEMFDGAAQLRQRARATQKGAIAEDGSPSREFPFPPNGLWRRSIALRKARRVLKLMRGAFVNAIKICQTQHGRMLNDARPQRRKVCTIRLVNPFLCEKQLLLSA